MGTQGSPGVPVWVPRSGEGVKPVARVFVPHLDCPEYPRQLPASGFDMPLVLTQDSLSNKLADWA